MSSIRASHSFITCILYSSQVLSCSLQSVSHNQYLIRLFFFCVIDDGEMSINKVVFIKTRVYQKEGSCLIASGPRGCISFWNIYHGGELQASFSGVRFVHIFTILFPMFIYLACTFYEARGTIRVGVLLVIRSSWV